MAKFVNTDSHTRTWVDLQTADGATVELEPGGTVELNLPVDFADPYLVPVTPAKTAKPSPASDTTT